jgi:hypothetical protein
LRFHFEQLYLAVLAIELSPPYAATRSVPPPLLRIARDAGITTYTDDGLNYDVMSTQPPQDIAADSEL